MTSPRAVRQVTPTVFLVLTLSAGISLAQAPPSADAIVRAMLAAAGGEAAFQQLGLLRMTATEEETTSDGKVHKSSFTAYVSTQELRNLRLEQGTLVLARNGDNAWATFAGKLDQRPQTPRMAMGTLNHRLIPLLFPYCLTMDRVSVVDVSSGTFEGKPAWRLSVKFGADFFASPVMNTTWAVYAAKEDGAFVAASFQPPAEFSEAGPEGVRYRYLKTQTVEGAVLPAEVLMEGLFANGNDNGHTRVVKIAFEPHGWDATLFLNAEQLEALDAEEDEEFDFPQ